MNVVEINNVTNTFSDHIAINDLLRTVPGGSIGGFIGPNRFANTTTLRMVMRIFPPDGGFICVLGETSCGAGLCQCMLTSRRIVSRSAQLQSQRGSGAEEAPIALGTIVLGHHHFTTWKGTGHGKT